MSTPVTPAAPVGAPPAIPRPNRTMIYVVAAAAVVVVALLVLVFVAPSFTSSGNSSVVGLQTYSQARPIANSAISGYQGGGWALISAVGFDTAVSETLPINETSLSTGNCSFTSTGSSGNLTIPGTSVNRSSGSSPAWAFACRNGADAIALVDVLSGTASVLGTLTGKCTALYGLLSAVPANVIDSSTAAAAVEPNASGFLAANPNASAEFALIGGISFLGEGIGAEWLVVYTTCSLSATSSGTGSEFNATVNATTGRVLYSATTGVTCAGTTTPTGPTYSLASSIAFDSFSIASHPPYTNYTFTVTTVGNGITWNNFTVQVENESGPILTGWTATAISSTNVTIATYDSTTGSWSVGGSQPIALGNGLLISTTADVSSDFVVLTGQGSFTGTLGFGFPSEG